MYAESKYRVEFKSIKAYWDALNEVEESGYAFLGFPIL